MQIITNSNPAFRSLLKTAAVSLRSGLFYLKQKTIDFS